MIMDTMYQTFQLQNSNCLPQKSHSSYWTREENKLFESALAIYDKNTPDRWEKVAQMIPGKSVKDVINQYKELEDDVINIEAGLVPTPGYLTSSFTLELGDDRDFDVLRKKSRARSADREKKKGLPWTEDEHRRFLMGLLKHGKGDWRSISRNFVASKTPTQVASHAQKYFLRLNSGLKDKRRPSIHDITTTNLSNAPPSHDSGVAAFDQFVVLPPREKEQNAALDWNQHGKLGTYQLRLLSQIYRQLHTRVSMALRIMESMSDLIIIPRLRSNRPDNAFADEKNVRP